LKADAFAYNHSTLIPIPVEEKNLMPVTTLDPTARQAYEQGFNVTLALDAMTDVRPEAHEYSLASVFPRLGETGSTHDILNLLATRSA
jgi:isochorismate hydrolase